LLRLLFRHNEQQSSSEDRSEVAMLRAGLRLLAVSIPLFFIGFLSLSSVWFEVLRLLGIACLVSGLALVLLDLARSPRPGGN
jgi:hypothetical protein